MKLLLFKKIKNHKSGQIFRTGPLKICVAPLQTSAHPQTGAPWVPGGQRSAVTDTLRTTSPHRPPSRRSCPRRPTSPWRARTGRTRARRTSCTSEVQEPLRFCRTRPAVTRPSTSECNRAAPVLKKGN